jgi:predicted DNA binding CopG/RHH family protein
MIVHITDHAAQDTPALLRCQGVPRSTPVLIRFNDDVIARAKTLAAKRHTGYQTLIKQFVTERLHEEEKRAGLR